MADWEKNASKFFLTLGIWGKGETRRMLHYNYTMYYFNKVPFEK